MSSLTVTGIPETIERAEFLKMLAGLGIAWDDLVEFTAESAGLRVTVYARAEDGERYVTRVGGDMNIATHSVFVRFSDEPTPPPFSVHGTIDS